MIKLYDHLDCPFSQKVRVVLAEKELEYERIFVDLRAGEQRTPEFLRLNPYGKVPVLVDEDLVVYDSTIINEYLEDEYPHPHLLPEDSAGRARVRMLEDYCDNSFLPVADRVLADLARPEAERDGERLKKYQAELLRGLARLEAALENKDFLSGEFSLADVAFAPRVLILPQLGVEVDPRLRQVAAWIERVRQRPSVATLGL
ncbi:MAG TPA: glutathione S-transferase family protein [Candidatus Binatia bacterium]|nr:glutathione S-transferase family protein [Candidatus Binatia bacterium]